MYVAFDSFDIVISVNSEIFATEIFFFSFRVICSFKICILELDEMAY